MKNGVLLSKVIDSQVVKFLANLLLMFLKSSLNSSVFDHDKFKRAVQGILRCCANIDELWVINFMAIVDKVSQYPILELCK